MTTNNELNERIKDFLIEKFPLARKRGITFQDDLLESGILDSLGILELVAFVEQNFGIVLSDDELLPENFQTIERLSAFVVSKSPSEASQQK
jgi:acyl carrier protein